MMLSFKYSVCTFGHFKLLLSGLDVRLVIRVLAVRPKCASNGDILVAFFRHILSSGAICFNDCFIINGCCFGSNLMHSNLRLTV